MPGWPGILVGDMSQPRGGPMFTGHASHQVGLDADIWLTPMPNRQLIARRARGNVRGHDGARRPARHRSRSVWTPSHLAVIRAAAQEPSVQRIFVNAAIKKALCREAKGDRTWLAQGAADVRPRLSLPHPHQMPARRRRMRAASPNRPRAKAAAPADLAYWFSDSVLHPKPPKVPPKPKPPMTMAATAAGLQSGVARAGCEAIDIRRRARSSLPRTALISDVAAP